MKKLLTVILLLLSLGLFAQSGCIKKPVTYGDTTISKAFFTWYASVPNLYQQKVDVNLTVFMSKSSMRNGVSSITVKELPIYFQLNCDTDGSKTWNQISDPVYIRNLVRNYLKSINPTWQNQDFEWY